ncbi:MAG: hypothetical protein GC162_12460 [Planctomycetes bacterium]|nr:hypothetical protein [Planctomycetota bacterium]
MNRSIHRRGLAALCVALLMCAAARAQDKTTELLNRMQQQIDTLQQQMAEKDAKIDKLQQQVDAIKTPEKAAASAQARKDALDAALADIEADQAQRQPAGGAALASVPLGGGASMKLIDISLDVLFNAGGSTVGDSDIQTLQGGGHDPKQRGFTLGQAELSLAGAIDPYLNGEAHIVFLVDPDSGETEAELEEAFATTTALPGGLQLKFGHFLSKFGLINPVHPHAWDWIDQPIINGRVFGGDGMRAGGVQISWLTPLPWYSELFLSVQNATGETMPSFLAADEAIGGRPFMDHGVRNAEDLTYTMHWANVWDLSDELSLSLGASGAFANNAAGGDTWIYGGDAKLKWKPVDNDHGWPFVIWQSEFIARDYNAQAAVHVGPDGAPGTVDDVLLSADELHDWGFYSQVLYGFHRDWAAGIRYEYATGSGNSVDEFGTVISHNDDPTRDSRHRISPLIMWQPTHFSRFRLQYNYDDAAHLGHGAHTVWLGVEFLFGAHPAHSY